MIEMLAYHFGHVCYLVKMLFAPPKNQMNKSSAIDIWLEIKLVIAFDLLTDNRLGPKLKRLCNIECCNL